MTQVAAGAARVPTQPLGEPDRDREELPTRSHPSPLLGPLGATPRGHGPLDNDMRLSPCVFVVTGAERGLESLKGQARQPQARQW